MKDLDCPCSPFCLRGTCRAGWCRAVTVCEMPRVPFLDADCCEVDVVHLLVFSFLRKTKATVGGEAMIYPSFHNRACATPASDPVPRGQNYSRRFFLAQRRLPFHCGLISSI